MPTCGCSPFAGSLGLAGLPRSCLPPILRPPSAEAPCSLGLRPCTRGGLVHPSARGSYGASLAPFTPPTRPRGPHLSPDLVQGLFALFQGYQGGSLLFSGLPQLQRPLAPFSGLPRGPGGGYPPQFGGQYPQSTQSLRGGSCLPFPRRFRVCGRASWLPVGVAGLALHPTGFPVAALQLGIHGRSLPPPSCKPLIPHGPLVLRPRALLYT